MNRPFRFVPFLRPMVWGNRRLQNALGKATPTDEPYGESWEVSDHPKHRSLVASGPSAGVTLRHLMETNRREFLGAAADQFEVFPWLVKFLDAHDWLSVQVHPDETAVRKLWPGEASKTEAWFVLDAAPGSRIYAGLLPGIDELRLRQALNNGAVADCLHQFEPRPGDCVFLPAGTVHAVGGGVLMAEIQQTSDATFRLFDWNRRDAQGKMRALHIEEAIASIHWNAGPVEPIRVKAFQQGDAKSETTYSEPLVRCPYFELDYLQSRESVVVGGRGRLQLLVVLAGRGELATSAGSDRFEEGEVWAVPASMPEAQCKPETTIKLLCSTLP